MKIPPNQSAAANRRPAGQSNGCRFAWALSKEGHETPRSPFDQVGGMVYFARMLDKIRLSARGQLPQDFQRNLGSGFDGRCTRYLHIRYTELVDRVHQGGSDEEILAWCFAKGRTLNEEEIFVWNLFMTKRGWNDDASEELEECKKASGLANRSDVKTFFEFFEVDEGRRE